MKTVYLDYNSTYPCDPKHVDAVGELLKKHGGNPSNIHSAGRDAKLALEEARMRVAALLQAKREELLFTSGATEANNWLLHSLVLGAKTKPHFLLSSIEHPSIRQTALTLAMNGACEVSFAPVDRQGYLDGETLLALLQDNTALVSVIHANNEVGTVNDIAHLAQRIKEKKPAIHFHSDAVQSFGKMDLKWLQNSAVDSVAIAAHKVGGFKGIGALWYRGARSLIPQVLGGGQERQLRAGTENLPGILSFGLRAKQIADNPDWLGSVPALKAQLIAGLQAIPGVGFHGDLEHGLATTLNFHCTGRAGDALLLQLDLAGICASSGSACSSGVGGPSAVLLAMGYSEWEAQNSVRVSFGASTTADEISYFLEVMRKL